jgi:hypothetical protein
MAEENGNGLSLEEEEFMNLRQKDQMCVLYKNQVATLKAVRGYNFKYKVVTVSIALLSAGIVILLKMHFPTVH